MPNDKEVFVHQVFLLVLGVIVGAVPTLFITTLQLRYQSREASREKQVAVLHDLAVSINGGGKVVAKYEALNRSVVTLSDASTQQDLNDFGNRADEAYAELANWTADMRAQGIVMESVFGASLPVPEFSAVPDIESYPAVNKAERKRSIELEKKDIYNLTTKVIALMNAEQKTLTAVARLVANER